MPTVTLRTLCGCGKSVLREKLGDASVTIQVTNPIAGYTNESRTKFLCPGCWHKVDAGDCIFPVTDKTMPRISCFACCPKEQTEATTHWKGCWRSHPRCAELLLSEIESITAEGRDGVLCAQSILDDLSDLAEDRLCPNP